MREAGDRTPPVRHESGYVPAVVARFADGAGVQGVAVELEAQPTRGGWAAVALIDEPRVSLLR